VDKVEIKAVKKNHFVEVIYDDHGSKFNGDVSHLGELFYKHNSSKGSGIGLYLIKNLMRKMQGHFEIENNDRLKFKLTFKAPTGGQDV
jgi:signal transduction histidine kinase